MEPNLMGSSSKTSSASSSKSSSPSGKKNRDSASEGDSLCLQGGPISPIACPLADEKLSKRLLKTVKKATKSKDIKRGVKEVVKSLRKGQRGLIILAGDVTPMDVLSHLPVLCEDHSILYVFIPSKASLGMASSTKRPTCCLMINEPKTGTKADYHSYYEEVVPKVKALHS